MARAAMKAYNNAIRFERDTFPEPDFPEPIRHAKLGELEGGAGGTKSWKAFATTQLTSPA